MVQVQHHQEAASGFTWSYTAYTVLPQTNNGWAMSHSNTPSQKTATLTARSSSSTCVSAAEHYGTEQYSKTGRVKPQRRLPRRDLSLNTDQDLLKIPSLWGAALETEWSCFSMIILESNVTPNITRSSDSFSTVLPIVDGGDEGCIVRDLETIIVLILLACNFIPQRSHYLLTLPMVTDQGLCYCKSGSTVEC